MSQPPPPGFFAPPVNPVYNVPGIVGPKPASFTCPSCRNGVLTKVVHNNSTKTHLIAAICCLLGCWLCFWIPYFMDSCRNANHYCPNCNAYIGTYKS